MPGFFWFGLTLALFICDGYLWARFARALARYVRRERGIDALEAAFFFGGAMSMLTAVVILALSTYVDGVTTH